jgi:Zn-dependent M16 (insulinase) family peptidase
MRHRFLFAAVFLALLMGGGGMLAQEVIDRVAARVENDIILVSDIRELARYQMLLEGKSESDEQILDRLIDQWIVRNEATVSRYAQPSAEEVQRSLARIKRTFASPEEFEERRQQSGLSSEELLAIVKSELYLRNYLDTRFRPAIQIEEKDVEDFYKTRVLPRAESRGQTPPTFEAAREFIQEALVQQAIDEQAERWLRESRSRIRVETLLSENKP